MGVTHASHRDLDSYMTVVFDPHYQSTFDAIYVYVVPWSDFPTVPSYPHYPNHPPPHRVPSEKATTKKIQGLVSES